MLQQLQLWLYFNQPHCQQSASFIDVELNLRSVKLVEGNRAYGQSSQLVLNQIYGIMKLFNRRLPWMVTEGALTARQWTHVIMHIVIVGMPHPTHPYSLPSPLTTCFVVLPLSSLMHNVIIATALPAWALLFYCPSLARPSSTSWGAAEFNFWFDFSCHYCCTATGTIELPPALPIKGKRLCQSKTGSSRRPCHVYIF